MNLNGKQTIAIVVVVLSVIIGSTAQLTDLFGAGATKIIISLASIMNAILSGVLSVISSQTGTVKDVQSMPGVEKLVVNREANSTLAAMAVDPAQAKIETKPGDERAVRETAQG